MMIRGGSLTTPQPIEFEYKGVTLKIDRDTGKVIDPSQVPFEANAAIKFTGAGEKPDWKDFKVGLANRFA
jgi:lupus La protein